MKSYLKSTLQIFLFFSLIFLSIPVNAAKDTPVLPSTCKVFCPDILYQLPFSWDKADKLTNCQDIQFKVSEKEKHNYWDVRSDRPNNITYSSPNTRYEYTKLNFGEKVRIAEIDRGYALVYRELDSSSVYPAISNEAISMGWIPLSKILLWDTCPINQNKTYDRAIFGYYQPIPKIIEKKGWLFYIVKKRKEQGFAFKRPRLS